MSYYWINSPIFCSNNFGIEILLVDTKYFPSKCHDFVSPFAAAACCGITRRWRTTVEAFSSHNSKNNICSNWIKKRRHCVKKEINRPSQNLVLKGERCLSTYGVMPNVCSVLTQFLVLGARFIIIGRRRRWRRRRTRHVKTGYHFIYKKGLSQFQCDIITFFFKDSAAAGSFRRKTLMT